MEISKIVSDCLSSNTFVLKKDGKALIVDAGASLGQVKSELGKCVPIGVLLTHGHYDHALNCLEYAEKFGVNIYASEKARNALNDPKINYGEGFKIDDFTNFVFLKDDGKIDIEGFEIDYFSTAGHSDCVVSYLIDRHLFVGDCIFADGIGRMDLITSNKKSMLSSLQKLSQLDYDVCHSGHHQDCDYERMSRNISVYTKYLSRFSK